MRDTPIRPTLRATLRTCLIAMLLAACDVDVPPDGRDLTTATLSGPETPFEVDVKVYQLKSRK